MYQWKLEQDQYAWEDKMTRNRYLWVPDGSRVHREPPLVPPPRNNHMVPPAGQGRSLYYNNRSARNPYLTPGPNRNYHDEPPRGEGGNLYSPEPGSNYLHPTPRTPGMQVWNPYVIRDKNAPYYGIKPQYQDYPMGPRFSERRSTSSKGLCIVISIILVCLIVMASFATGMYFLFRRNPLTTNADINTFITTIMDINGVPDLPAQFLISGDLAELQSSTGNSSDAQDSRTGRRLLAVSAANTAKISAYLKSEIDSVMMSNPNTKANYMGSKVSTVPLAGSTNTRATITSTFTPSPNNMPLVASTVLSDAITSNTHFGKVTINKAVITNAEGVSVKTVVPATTATTTTAETTATDAATTTATTSATTTATTTQSPTTKATTTQPPTTTVTTTQSPTTKATTTQPPTTTATTTQPPTTTATTTQSPITTATTTQPPVTIATTTQSPTTKATTTQPPATTATTTQPPDSKTTVPAIGNQATTGVTAANPDSQEATTELPEEIASTTQVQLGPITDVRILSGNNQDGYVQVKVGSTWMYVCAKAAPTSVDNVICSLAGFPGRIAIRVPQQQSVGGSADLITTMSCTVNCTVLDDCQYMTGKHCPKPGGGRRILIIKCVESEASGKYPVRVSGGSTYLTGRVEYFYQGTWYGVCAASWKQAEADAFCKAFCYDGPSTALTTASIRGYYYPIAHYGPHPLYDITTLYSNFNCPCDADGLHDCGHSEPSSGTQCAKKDMAAVKCHNVAPKNTEPFQIRMVEKKARCGRVEVYVGGKWGAVCDDNWDDLDADVACKQLGMQSPGFAFSCTNREVKLTSRPPFLMDDVECTKSNTKLEDCLRRTDGYHNCGPFEYACICCGGTRPGVEIKVKLEPLQGGKKNTGLVLVQLPFTIARADSKKWGSICADEFGIEEARIICKAQGINTPAIIMPDCEPQKDYPAVLDNLDCPRRAYKMIQCSNQGLGRSDCNPPRPVCVSCDASDIRVNLEGLKSSRAGVIVIHKGASIKGTVCRDGFDPIDANITCQTMGFNSSTDVSHILAFERLNIRQQSGSILLSNVECTDADTSLITCDNDGWNVHQCTHKEDVAVACVDTADTEMSFRLAPYYGEYDGMGRLELKMSDIWGTVCDDKIKPAHATLICKDLGFTDGYLLRGSQLGAGSGVIWGTGFSCPANAVSIDECTLTEQLSAKCDHRFEDSSLVCYTGQPPEPTFKFNQFDQQLSYFYGTVEAEYDNVPTTVCGTVSDQTADALCKDFGFESGNAKDIGHMNKSPVLLSNLKCETINRTLECTSDDWGSATSDDCVYHRHDTVVVCIKDVPCPPGQVACDNKKQCIPSSRWCDNNRDCFDYSDEKRGCNAAASLFSFLGASGSALLAASGGTPEDCDFDSNNCGFLSIGLSLQPSPDGGKSWQLGQSKNSSTVGIRRLYDAKESYEMTIGLNGSNVDRFIVWSARTQPSIMGFDMQVVSGYQLVSETNVSVTLRKGPSALFVLAMVRASSEVFIDNLFVVEKNCSDVTKKEIACPKADDFRCTYSRECVPASQRCDTLTNCLDQTDELDCPASLKPCCCSFEKDTCGWVSSSTSTTSATSEKMEWKRWAGTAPGFGNDLKYSVDHHQIDLGHTHLPGWPWSNKKLGPFYYAVLKGFNQTAGTSATYTSPELCSCKNKCLRFYYYGGGTLRGNLEVIAKHSGKDESLWKNDGSRVRTTPSASLSGWLFAQIELDTKVTSVSFVGTMGYVPVSYMAIDRVTIREGSCPDIECPLGSSACGDGQCIPSAAEYDYKTDCTDMSDTSNGTFEECGAGYKGYFCLNGTGENSLLCLAPSQECDGINDCPASDNATKALDEIINCKPKPVCRPGWWPCKTSGRCIPNSWICDDIIDCKDLSDEKNCGGSGKCFPYGKCRNGVALEASDKLCDRIESCEDLSDEENCDAIYNVAAGKFCPDDQFTCETGACVHKKYRCDGRPNCADGSDELDCPCRAFKVQCDRKCLDTIYFCDGCEDCADGTDEPDKCQIHPSVFECDNGERIPGDKYCDKNPTDCSDGSDEKNCNGACNPDWGISCDGQCKSLRLKCDGKNDCSDGTDEMGCTNCPYGKALCSNGQCIDKRHWCDHVPDCSDCSDEEENCKCNDAQFECQGKCYPNEDKCDRFPDCPSAIDEKTCCPRPGQRKCVFSGERIPAFRWCDSWTDCNDASDEIYCKCSPDEFRCDSGRCISMLYRCNFADECGDGSDERDCRPACRPGQVPCSANCSVCITGQEVCDGTKDCPGGEDEDGCDTCASDELKCITYSCVNKTMICDGKQDCPDGKDEHLCARIKDDTAYIKELKVCSTGWTKGMSNYLCARMGLGDVSLMSTKAGTAGEMVMDVTSTNDTQDYDALIQEAEAISLAACSSGRIVTVACEQPKCGYRSKDAEVVDPFIIGGKPAADCEWPWNAQLWKDGRYYCTASLIADDWILTAAHCVIPYGQTVVQTWKFYLRIGTKNKISGGTLIYPKAIFYNPGFSYAKLINDVALIKLSKPVTLSDCIKPLCLPPANIRPETPGWECWGTGWGYTKPRAGDLTLPENLVEAKFQFANDCQGPQGPIPSSQICVGTHEYFPGTCNADSGGPLQCAHYTNPKRWYVFGITSYGPGGCVNGRGVYTRVTYYQNWIEDTIAKYDNSNHTCT